MPYATRVLPALLLLLTAACASARSKQDAFNLGSIEASIYSMPYIEARAVFKVDEQQFLVSRTPHPELIVHWKMLDNSPGVGGDCEVRMRIMRDDAFPVGEKTRWVEERAMHRHQRRNQAQRKYSHQGVFRYRTPVDPIRPVRRYKIILESKVISSVTTNVDREERIVYVAIQPQWRTYRHHHTALLKMAKLAYNRKQAFLRWKEYIWQARIANRSLKDARGFSSNEIRKILVDTKRLLGRTPSDTELEEIASDVITQSGKVLGQLARKIDAVSSEILGVTRLGYDYLQVAGKLLKDTDNHLGKVSYLRNFLVTFLALEHEAEVDKRLDRIIYFCNQELKSLSYLWITHESSELAVMLNKLTKALSMESEEITALGKRLEIDLGRDYQKHTWKPVQKSAIFTKYFPKRYVGNKNALCNTLRTSFLGLYYLLKTERFYVKVLKQAVGQSLQAFQATAARVALKPQFEPRLYPDKLHVAVHVSGHSIRPGKIAEYPVTVRNTDLRAHEVRVTQTRKLPSGWFARMTQDTFLLKPGERRTFIYHITAPFYAQTTQHVRSLLRIYFNDDPGRYHETALVTRVVVGGESISETPDVARHHQLQVTAPKNAAKIRPGQLVKFPFFVRNAGPTRRLVLCKLLSTLAGGWVAEVAPKRLWLRPGEEARVFLRVTTPLYVKQLAAKEFLVGVGYADEFTRMEKLRFTTAFASLKITKAAPQINSGKQRSYFITKAPSTDCEFTLANMGNAVDTFDLFLSAPPRGWYLKLPRKFVRLGPGQVERLPFKIHPPSSANVGEHQEVTLTAVSTTHPEIQHRKRMVFTIINQRELVLRPVKNPIFIAPGDAKTVALEVTNRSARALKLGFRPAVYNPRPTWIKLTQPLRNLPPGSTRMIYAHIRVPRDRARVGEKIPFHVSAVNELGDEVHACGFDVIAAKRHKVDLTLDSTGTRRSHGGVTCKLIVTNTGTVADNFVFLLSGKERKYWARVSPRKVALGPEEQATVVLLVRIPHDAQQNQTANIQVQAKSVTDSSARDFVEVKINPKYR